MRWREIVAGLPRNELVAESDQQADADRRGKAAERRQKTIAAADKVIRSTAMSDAPPGVKAAKTATQNAKKREAYAAFRAAVAEGVGEGHCFAPVTLPPGKTATHFDAAGRRVGSTEWDGDELVTKSANGVVIGRTVIR